MKRTPLAEQPTRRSSPLLPPFVANRSRDPFDNFVDSHAAGRFPATSEQAVDFMAKFDTSLSCSVLILNVPLHDLLHILQHDISSSSNGPIRIF
ncbi:hypothetical protein GQ457_08G000850 [Hibiscus cannabinus]